MILLDAYALVAVLTRGPALDQVTSLLRRGGLGIPTLNLAEVLDVAERVKGLPAEVAWGGIEPLLGNAIAPIPLTLEIAREAASVRARHYHGKRRPLSLADCVLLASGDDGDRLATADPHILAVAPEEGLSPIGLPGEAT